MSRLRIATMKAGRQEPPFLTMDLPLCLRHSHKNISPSPGPATSARLRRWPGELHDHHGRQQPSCTPSAGAEGPTGLLHCCINQLASIPTIVKFEALKGDVTSSACGGRGRVGRKSGWPIKQDAVTAKMCRGDTENRQE